MSFSHDSTASEDLKRPLDLIEVALGAGLSVIEFTRELDAALHAADAPEDGDLPPTPGELD